MSRAAFRKAAARAAITALGAVEQSFKEAGLGELFEDGETNVILGELFKIADGQTVKPPEVQIPIKHVPMFEVEEADWDPADNGVVGRQVHVKFARRLDAPVAREHIQERDRWLDLDAIVLDCTEVQNVHPRWFKYVWTAFDAAMECGLHVMWPWSVQMQHMADLLGCKDGYDAKARKQ